MKLNFFQGKRFKELKGLVNIKQAGSGSFISLAPFAIELMQVTLELFQQARLAKGFKKPISPAGWYGMPIHKVVSSEGGGKVPSSKAVA